MSEGSVWRWVRFHADDEWQVGRHFDAWVGLTNVSGPVPAERLELGPVIPMPNDIEFLRVIAPSHQAAMHYAGVEQEPYVVGPGPREGTRVYGFTGIPCAVTIDVEDGARLAELERIKAMIGRLPEGVSYEDAVEVVGRLAAKNNELVARLDPLEQKVTRLEDQVEDLLDQIHSDMEGGES